ncbi:insulinase family protein [Hymenobacter taeanensis]|uniref:Insulinase family protein n=1 Tax=Hymenobacter taeanensis TaxID=2735321 RepID=A0A6M6BKX3_9BACT|nr:MULTISPECIES: pitrilysin family protein [Hymenobacter]QJX47715.1 insulinase family protein [Hymenobacter taeanensis]UOQ82800.1 insulinase family protein [Hymenobacter sp. 5414T-23]
MKHTLQALLLSTALLAGPAAEAQKASAATTTAAAGSINVFPYPIQQKQLANGLNVVTVPFDSPGLASFFLVVRAGSRDEVEPGHTGFAHFFEHVMFRGTDKYSKEQYDEVLQSIGAAANANTSLDRTVYHMTGNARMLEKMFEVEADRFQNLKYAEHDFKAEAGAVKGEYTKNSASLYSQLNEKVADAAFDKHTYEHTTMGFFKDIVDMPNQYQYSLSFFDRFYRPEYTTLLVVGDVKSEEVNKLADKYFASWKRGTYTPNITPEPAQTAPRAVHIQNANFPPLVSLSYRGPAFSDRSKDLPALEVLTTMLFAENSPLYQQLVVKEQKVRFVGGSPNYTRDPYLMTIRASVVKPQDLSYVKDQITKALEEMKTKPVDAKRLADTKSALKYGFLMGLDSPDQVANALAQFIWLTGDVQSLNRFYAQYDQVTPADIQAVAQKYFVPESLTVGTIGPGATSGLQ